MKKKAIIFYESIPILINYLLHNNDEFDYDLSIVAIIKNEAPYIKEWIEYHKLVGVQKFYIYDNESTDNVKNILKPYIENGEVYYKYVLNQKKGKPQARVYTETVRKFKNKTKWLAAIDLDEFLVPMEKDTIQHIILDIEKEYSKHILVGLAIHWVPYGYCGHISKPEGLVIENYIKSSGVSKTIKSIVNPRTVIRFSHQHYAEHFFGFRNINENGSIIDKPAHANNNVTKNDIQKIRINHYFTKSFEEYKERLIKNVRGDGGYTNISPNYDPEYSSSIDDFVMKKYIHELKIKLSQKA